jgi:hypothetical protein
VRDKSRTSAGPDGEAYRRTGSGADALPDADDFRLRFLSDLSEFRDYLFSRGQQRLVFWPLAVDRTLWEARTYLPPPANAAERLVQEFICTRLRIVLDEDAAGHETVHAGLANRAKKNLLFQDEEIQLRHFHKNVEDHVGITSERADAPVGA